MALAQFSLSIGDITDLIQTIAVVVSLVYLAIQVKDSTKSTRGATYQSIISAFAEVEARISQDADTARLYRLGCKEPESLTEDEAVRFKELICSLFNLYENLHYQYKNHLLEEDLWTGWCRLMMNDLQAQGIAKYWKMNAHLYSQDFRQYIKAGKCPKN